MKNTKSNDNHNVVFDEGIMRSGGGLNCQIKAVTSILATWFKWNWFACFY